MHVTGRGTERVGLLLESASHPALPTQLFLCIHVAGTPWVQGTNQKRGWNGQSGGRRCKINRFRQGACIMEIRGTDMS